MLHGVVTAVVAVVSRPRTQMPGGILLPEAQGQRLSSLHPTLGVRIRLIDILRDFNVRGNIVAAVLHDDRVMMIFVLCSILCDAAGVCQ